MITPVKRAVNMKLQGATQKGNARSRRSMQEECMNDWYSLLLAARERESEALGQSKLARHIPRRRQVHPDRSRDSLRLFVGSTLIRLGEAIGGNDRSSLRDTAHG
jgi:hypothetical protein